MKKFFILAAIMASTSAAADDFSLYLDTQAEQNNEVAPVANLQKITFTDGMMVVIHKDGTTATQDLSNVKRLFFSTPEAVGIESPEQDKPVSADNRVYDLTGRLVTTDLRNTTLPQGIYITDGKKIQIRKK